MKTKFKKLNLLVYGGDRTKVTSMLQELGVLHLELDETFRNESIEDLEFRRNRLTKAIDFIQACGARKKIIQRADGNELSVSEVVDEVLTLKLKKEADEQEEELLRKHKQKLMPWGDFDPDKLARLDRAGIKVSFYSAEKKSFKAYDFRELAYQIIHEGPDRIYLVVFSRGETISLPFETIELPSLRISDLHIREQELNTAKAEFTKTIPGYTCYLPMLEEELVRLENQWMLQLANGSYDEHAKGSILHLTGWFPATMEGRLLHYFQQEKLSYTISDPVSGDKVPVLLNNPNYPKLFESITRIFQLPDYYEMDLTPFIAVFYPILFAYCLGDAGYGLVLLLAALIGGFTFLKASRNMAVLGVILGVFTTLMGVVKSGSIFGQPIIADYSYPLLQFLSQYVIIPDDRDVVFNAFNVALLIGVVQIFTGIIISIINKMRYHSLIASLPQLGKLFIVVSLIWMFLADMQGVESLQPFALGRKILLTIGVLLVLFFHDMKLPIVARTASGVLPLFFILTGILGDVLSYVRLFALGVASSVLGLVVNQIGMTIMGDTWWGILLAIVFLLVGHGLNFALATLGAFVHPLRLTFVEFYNNANFEGGGVPYKPLRKIK
ncbi:MAG: V-type ATP synthase subunit I [Bacteroidota bacterium]